MGVRAAVEAVEEQLGIGCRGGGIPAEVEPVGEHLRPTLQVGTLRFSAWTSTRYMWCDLSSVEVTSSGECTVTRSSLGSGAAAAAAAGDGGSRSIFAGWGGGGMAGGEPSDLILAEFLDASWRISAISASISASLASLTFATSSKAALCSWTPWTASA